MSPRARTARSYALCVGVVLVMAYPALRRPPLDDFPLSSYPMFATARGDVVKIRTVLGVTAEGATEVLTPSLIAGDGSPTLASDVGHAAARSVAKRRALCETVAARVAHDPEYRSRYVELRFVSEVYDAPAYFRGQTETRSSKVLSSCTVPR